MTDERHIDDDARLDAASEWMVRLEEGGPEDALAFDAWLDASPENARAFDQVARVASAYAAVAPEVLAGLDAERRKRERRLGFGGGLAAVGGLAAAAALAVAVLPQFAAAPTLDYATGRGEHRTVRLADGSTIQMNAASKLSVTLARGERRVVMGEGEAVFDVAKDARRPFLIAAGDRQVRVVGTQFDVRRRGEQLSVTVARGVVEVRPVGQDGGRTFRLHPGQRLDHRAGAGELVSAASPDEVLGWRSGRLVYRDQPLSQVVADLNLQFDRPIRLEDASLGQTRVSGVLVLDDEAAVVRRLALLAPLSAVTSDQGVVLRRTEAKP